MLVTLKRAVFAVAIFLAAATTSYLDHYVGIAFCAVVFVAYLLIDRVTLCFLVIFSVPITQIFGLSSDDLVLVQEIGLVILAALALIELSNGSSQSKIKHTSYGMIFVAFFVLVILHFTSFAFLEIEGGIFLGVLLLIFWLVRMNPCYHRAVCLGMVISGIVGGVLSFAFTYIPIPSLIMEPPTFDKMRMAGVFAGQNAAGRCLIPAFVYFLTLTSKDLRWSLAVTLCAILVVVTASKAAIIAMVAATAFSGVYGARRTLLAGTTAIILAAGYLVTLHPILVDQASAVERSSPKSVSNEREKSVSHEQDMSGSIAQELRLGRSTLMKELPNGQITKEEREYDLWHTGQRDVLWSAGVQAIKQHPFWGIGYKKWSEFMQDTTGYPFRSPHNGFLEVAGGYGILGSLLYVLLLVLVTLNMWRSKETFDIFLKWASLSLVTIPFFEAFDASMSLAVTLSAVWFWALAGVQESRLYSASSGTTVIPASK